MNLAIDINNLTQDFGLKKSPVLDQLNLQIKQGESFVVVGSSGSGKTVLLKHLIGFLHATKGSVNIDNCSAQDYVKESIANIGILFQEIGLFDFLTCKENITFALKNKEGFDPQELDEKAEEALTNVGIKEKNFDSKPGEISLGMAKRVGFARTIVREPKFLFLDEPTAGLDPVLSAKISAIIQKNIQTINATIFTITHDLKLACSIADRIGLLKDGKFEWIGTPKEFLESDNAAVREFLDSVSLQT